MTIVTLHHRTFIKSLTKTFYNIAVSGVVDWKHLEIELGLDPAMLSYLYMSGISQWKTKG